MSSPPAARNQIAFLLLLLVAVAQVFWWIYDQGRYSRERQQELIEAYESERLAAERLLQSGALGPEAWNAELAQRFPHLELIGDRVRVSPLAIAELERERRSHLNQYRWEGAFFLLVLVAGIWVIRRALLGERQLRLRQENFLAAVSHELKSPIASLRLAGDTMARPELDAPRRQALLERSQRDLDRLEDLVIKVLDTSRIEAGGVSTVPERLRLAPLLRGLVAEGAPPRGAMARAEPEVEVDVAEELELEADRVAVETVVRNLLSNAHAAVAGRDEPRIVVRARRSGATPTAVELVVEDNGVGCPPQESERLFEKFYRVGDELRRRSRGTGLGLYLVRRFVELEGGEVSASSPGDGGGAIFRVVWPGTAAVARRRRRPQARAAGQGA